MRIYFANNRFEAQSRFEEKDQLKSRGWRWDPQVKRWWTDEAVRVEAFRAVCDASALRELGTESKLDASRATDAEIDVPAPEGRTYLPFQRAGIAYALNRPATLIGDEMGLGKTIQAVGVLNSTTDLRRALIVCPASVKSNWVRELEGWLTHDLTIGEGTTQEIPDTDIVVANYEAVVKQIDVLSAITWDVLIVDEVHYIKTATTKRTKAIKQLRAARKIGLTGTPIVNRPSELFSILSFLDPQRWDNWYRFTNRYCVFETVWAGKRRGHIKKISNQGKNLGELHDTLRGTLMVRRLKSEVLTELPPKFRSVIELPWPAGTAGLQADMEDLMEAIQESSASTDIFDTLAGISGSYRLPKGAEVSTLRRRLGETKAAQVAEYAQEILESKDKVVIFGHHHGVIDALVNALAEYHPAVIDGRTPQQHRQAEVDRFQNDPNCRVFVGSIGAAGVGITLTASDMVLMAELDWVPGNVKQAEDRCHRIGSEVHDNITVQYLVYEKSLDSYIARMLSQKLATIEAALDKPAPVTVSPELPAASQPVPSALPGGEPQREAIHEALRLLAGLDPDRAGILNDMGFNGLDTAFGHSLAEAPRLTDRQALAGRKMLVKYHRQIPAEIYNLAVKGVDKIAASR